MFGNHSGEPCYRSGDFDGSRCSQAYRWMLDKVVDVNGNASRYYYDTETGYYAAAVDKDSDAAAYTRSGWLSRIEYGLRADDPTVEATGQVRFSVGDRCLEDCYNSSEEPKEANWPDVPWDMDCESGTGCEQYSPVFFSTKRLTEITTYVWNAGAGAFDDVDSWSLTHEFKDYGDSSQVVLWLSSIQHTGLVGGSETMPPVEFGATFLPNRVEDGTGNPGIWRPRLTSVKNETGGTVSITYSEPDCDADTLPTNAEDNTRRCYPTWYVPEGLHQAEEAYFHKYIVAEVIESDTTAGGEDIRTAYTYSTDGGGTDVLWAWNDSEFTDDDKRTYNQWRGYAQVTTLVGDPQEAEPRLRSATRYYRGLDGQPLPDGGERSINLTGTQGDTAVDHEALAGQVWEQISYEDTRIIGSTTTRYWTQNTATRAHDGGELKAWMTGPDRVEAATRLSLTAWRTTTSTTVYDDLGRAVEVSDEGDTATAGDEQCVRTGYADNTSAWILDAPSRIETVAVGCGSEVSRPDDVVSDVRAYYDGGGFGETPTRGLMTKSETLDHWDSGPVYATLAESTFDDLGRETSATNALGEVTTTTYTPASGGPLTAVTETNPLGHVDSATYEPAWGAMLTATGVNDQVTTVEYDQLGRRTAVWLPGQDHSAGEVPNLKFSYAVSDTAPSAVTTESMIWDESYLTKIELFDGLLRSRQTQADTYGGRLITQTVYNSRGQVAYASGANFNNDSGPTADLVRISRPNDVARTEYVYDAAGRVTDEIYVVKDDEKWRTTTAYGGHDDYWQTTVTPPQGASATATLADARGRTVELHRFHGNTPTGEFDTTSYDYTNRGLLATVTDPAGNQWAFDYDLRGRQIATDDPDTGHSTTTFNTAGQVVSTTDANGTVLSYEYDPLGRKTAKWEGPVDSGTLLSEWTYDTADAGIGLPHTATNWIDGQAWTESVNEYDEAGRPTDVSTFLPEAAGALEGEWWQSFTYHPDGSLRTSGAVGAGDLRSEVIIYGYNEMGQASRVASNSPDFGVGNIYVDKAVYSPYGQLLQRRLGDPDDVGGTSGQVWQTWIYEEGTGRLAEFYFDKDTAGEFDGTNYGIAALSYDYDQAGNVLSITDEPVHSSDALQPETQCFEYDHLNRLTEAWAQAGAGECAEAPSGSAVGGPGAYWSSYEYDLTGNRTSETRWTTAGRMTDTYTYESTGHALTEVATEENGGERDVYTYDEAGFTTSIDRAGDLSILDWNANGRLETVSNGEETTRFFDSADGDRLARIDPDGNITAWAAGYELTWNAAQNTIEVRRYYNHGGATVGLRIGRGDIQFLSGDHHGTGQWIVNADTLTATVRRFDPFGNERGLTQGTWPDQRGFVGGIENETTGLTTLGAREYDPTTGRFISVDPLADYSDAQQLNGYAYALNNPVTLSDPSGLSTQAPQTGMIPDWCGGTPVSCTGWHWPDEIGGDSETGGTDSNWSGTGASDEDDWVEWDEWTYTAPGQAGCMQDNGWDSPQDAGMSIFGTCVPPLPVNASHDADAFMFYCFYYGIDTTGSSCSAVADAAGLDVESLIEPQSLEEFGQTILDLTIVGDIKDCANGQLSGCAWAAADLFGGKVLKWGSDLWSAMRKAQKACNSFTEGTLVVMADGSTKPIEQVEPGDEVLSFDILTGETVGSMVSGTMTTSNRLRDLVIIGTDSDRDGQVDGEITATAGHAFWVAETGDRPQPGYTAKWRIASNIGIGAWLRGSNGEWNAIREVSKTDRTVTTFNLSIARTHAFYVVAGAQDSLVHNEVLSSGFTIDERRCDPVW